MDSSAVPSSGGLSWMLQSQDRTYQQVDGAAHAVVLALIAHHGAIIQQPLQEPSHQAHKAFHQAANARVLLGTLCKAANAEILLQL